LVRGVPITRYCDQRQLPLKARLDLFLQVCQGVQHAHQKVIIHRDLKPSNILVAEDPNSDPTPKIIDFGIAKAIAGKLTHATINTGLHQFIATPAYMSPELAVMTSEDIDTRSDIYSLGVLLYELLTGKPPFNNHELLTAGLDEMRRIIREEDQAEVGDAFLEFHDFPPAVPQLEKAFEPTDSALGRAAVRSMGGGRALGWFRASRLRWRRQTEVRRGLPTPPRTAQLSPQFRVVESCSFHSFVCEKGFWVARR
jgi:serine/threonine protein kinase